jgi:hypothetical protein
VVLLDAATDNNAVLIGFLGLGPVIAGIRGRPRSAVVVAAAAIVCGLVLGEVDSFFFSSTSSG